MNRSMKLLVSVVVMAGLSAIGCGKKESPEAHAQDAGPPLAVRVIQPTSTESASLLVLPARVKAREEVTISALAPGRLTALPIAEGGKFSRGDALARFEASETKSAIDAARAALFAAEVRRAQAVLQESRFDSLFAERVASRRELELAQADRGGAEAAEAQAKAALAQILTSSTIQAPFSGVVVRHREDVGMTVHPGQPLLDVRSNDASEIEVAVPESEIDRASGSAVEVQINDGAWEPATLDRFEGMTDYATRTRIAFLRTREDLVLAPGAYARVRFLGTTDRTFDSPSEPAVAGASAGRLLVPEASLVRRGALAGVFVAQDGKARLRWLRLGHSAGDRVEVLAGLLAGDEVILDPHGLTDGRSVEVSR